MNDKGFTEMLHALTVECFEAKAISLEADPPEAEKEDDEKAGAGNGADTAVDVEREPEDELWKSDDGQSEPAGRR